MNSDMEYSCDESDDFTSDCQEDLFCLIFKEFDGKGVFSVEPHVHGMAKLVHQIPRRELSTTLRSVLERFVDLRQYEFCKDEMNLVEANSGVPVYLDLPIWTIFNGKWGHTRTAKIYLRNHNYLEEDFEDETLVEKFDSLKNIVTTLTIVILIVGLCTIGHDSWEFISEHSSSFPAVEPVVPGLYN